jgi:hypothetical protein
MNTEPSSIHIIGDSFVSSPHDYSGGFEGRAKDKQERNIVVRLHSISGLFGQFQRLATEAEHSRGANALPRAAHD